jgi:hypothetical protein
MCQGLSEIELNVSDSINLNKQTYGGYCSQVNQVEWVTILFSLIGEQWFSSCIDTQICSIQNPYLHSNK